MKQMTVDRLNVLIYDTRAQMGAAAAKDGAEALKRVIAKKGSANVMFAAAFSQKELLEGLTPEQQEAARCYLSIQCSMGGMHIRKGDA